MNLFETVKAGVGTREAAMLYGLEVDRRNMALCPFHNDRHPSLLVADDHYHCFACGKHGDVIDLTAGLLDLRPYEAARKLASDFQLTPDKPLPESIHRKLEQKAKAQKLRAQELHCQRVLCDYLHLLEDWKERYAPSGPEDEWDDRFVEASQMLSRIEYLADVLTFADLEVRIKTVDMLSRDGTINRLEERMKRMKKEAAHYGKERENI